MAERPFDIILWGCTGFTGGLVAEYFASSAPRGVRWALAGRTRSKLQAVKANLIKLNADCEQLEILEADISDQNSLEALAAQTKVILSTAGPFTLCGTPIVDACVKQSTSYCDITGESPWVKGLIEKYHEEALAKNIHIVPMCGFDSVPFDLGAFMLAQEAQQHGGAKWIRGYAESNGRPSGGTLHTILLLSGTVPTSVMANPRLLNPANHANDPLPAGAKDQALPRYDSYIKSWTGPFVMAGVNTRVVRRSQCLYADAGRPYGPAGFFYNESEIHKGFFSALISTLGLGVFATLLFFSLGRAFLRRVVPSPGQGPSAETRAKSWFRVRFVCEAVDGTILKGQVAGGDPGYSETAKMISNAALSLLDKEALPSPGGVLTPATAMGNTLIERLRNAGMTFQLDHRTIRNVWA